MRVLRSAAAAPETPVAILHRTGFIGQNADARAGRREYVCQYVCQCAMPPVCVYVRVSVSASATASCSSTIVQQVLQVCCA